MPALPTPVLLSPPSLDDRLALDSCRLRSAGRNSLRFAGQTRSRSPVVAAPAAAALASLPWLAESASNWQHGVVSAGFFSLGIGLLKMGLPQRLHLEVSPEDGTIRCNGSNGSLGVDACYRLRLAPPDLAPQCLYWITLDTGDGRIWPLLVGPRPDLLLHDLNRCLEHLSLPVLGTWGSPKGAEPWRFNSRGNHLSHHSSRSETRSVGAAPPADPSPPNDANSTLAPAPPATGRIVARRTDPALPRLMFCVLLGVASILAVHAGIGLQHGTRPPHPLSLLLPCLWVGYLAFVAFAASARSQVCVRNTVLSVRGGIFGRASRKVPRSHVRHVHVVGEHPEAEVCHLLVETDSGPLAARVRQSEASEFAHAVAEQLLGNSLSPHWLAGEVDPPQLAEEHSANTPAR